MVESLRSPEQWNESVLSVVYLYLSLVDCTEPRLYKWVSIVCSARPFRRDNP
jgi:hypothetical protein